MKNTFKPITVLLSIFLIGFNINASAQNKNLKSENNSSILIAKVKDGVSSFVVDQNVLIKDWEKFISRKNNSKLCRLNQPQIVSNKLSNKYYLIATRIFDTISMRYTIALKQINGNCLVLMNETIQCARINHNDNEEGCIPNNLACIPCYNKNNCEKTITSSPLVIFPSITPSVCE